MTVDSSFLFWDCNFENFGTCNIPLERYSNTIQIGTLYNSLLYFYIMLGHFDNFVLTSIKILLIRDNIKCHIECSIDKQDNLKIVLSCLLIIHSS